MIRSNLKDLKMDTSEEWLGMGAGMSGLILLSYYREHRTFFQKKKKSVCLLLW